VLWSPLDTFLRTAASTPLGGSADTLGQSPSRHAAPNRRSVPTVNSASGKCHQVVERNQPTHWSSRCPLPLTTHQWATDESERERQPGLRNGGGADLLRDRRSAAIAGLDSEVVEVGDGECCRTAQKPGQLFRSLLLLLAAQATWDHVVRRDQATDDQPTGSSAVRPTQPDKVQVD
jgi:hypothetical protein